MKSVLIVTPDMGDNSTGRAYVWWLLARELGWDVNVVSFSGERMWDPLIGSLFSSDSAILHAATARERARLLADLAASVDVVVSVKPLPQSLGLCLRARRRGAYPLIVDVDDPDLEARLHRGNLARRFLWRVRYFRFWRQVHNFAQLATTVAISVSNPTLEKNYGGTVVPHAREAKVYAKQHTSWAPKIAFIGTVRRHKGIDVLRAAAADAAKQGVSLVITADPPVDAFPWEEWVGECSLEAGEAILSSADVVALPSLPSSFAVGQLPAKLIDAMMNGAVVVASEIDPMPWALGTRELCVTPGSISDLSAKIEYLRDPSVRQVYSEQLRARALELFSVEAVAPSLAALAREAEIKAYRRTPRASARK